ncbi:MAG: hypothetical protein ACL7BU_08610 [Candidatus Phlomobacter fragariae]
MHFSRVPFEHNGNVYEESEMTKNGFIFLVMGFTDKKAAQFKELPTLLSLTKWKQNLILLSL